MGKNWFCALALSASSAFAASYIVPSDADMVRAAKGIVIATAMGSHTVATERDVFTVYELRVDEAIKGNLRVADTIEVMEPGGCAGKVCVGVPGAPVYRPGERALVFLDSDRERPWSTWNMSLGKFNFVHDLHGKALLVRGGSDGEIFGWSTLGSAHVEPLRDEQKFLDFVRTVGCGGAAQPNYVVPREGVVFAPPVRADANSQGFHASNYVNPDSARWKCIFDQPAGSMPGCGGNGSATYTLFGTAAGVDGPGAANAGMNAWNGDALSNVNLVAGSSVAAAPWDRLDGASSIHFDDNADTAACGSQAVGCGSYTFTSDSYMFDGSTFVSIVAGDVALKAGFTTNQTLYNQVVCHELGHTIGLRHSDQGTPSTSGAVMVSVVDSAGSSVFGAVLQQWDHDAVSTMYNPSPGVVCTAPSITRQPSDQTITAGNQANLSVAAGGTAPFTYLWYTGAPPTGPVAPGPNNNGATYNPSPTSTTTYWVRVTNSCGTIDSAVATVTVNPATCAPPAITAQPTGSTITAGQIANLNVGASGTAPLTFQWYIGTPSNTATPAGTGQSINVSPSSTTTYWVRVTGQCGTPVDSNAVTVTVNAQICNPPFVVNEPGDQQIISGNPATLFVGYSGSISTVTWFRGVQNDTTNPIGTGQSFTTAPLTSTTQFWAQLVNGCGTAKSRTVTITVLAACVPPAIASADASPKTVAPGGTVTLTVQATGTGLQFQWYRGISPDISNPVPGATTAVSTDAPPASTSYFVRVSNSCGTKDSDPVRVVVAAACTPPSVTAISDDTTISSNTTVTLAVAATGDAVLHYQWFRGPSADESNPVGTDSASFTPPPLFSDAQFWVKVSNACAPPAKSKAVKVTVIPARHRASRK